MEDTKTVIEINGVKMEVDLRHAKRIDTLVVGSKVKLLIKESGYSSVSNNVYSGVVVGFEPFQDMPTIIVCYLDLGYQETTLKFAYINDKSNDKYDLIVSIDDELPVQKQDVLSRIDREIEKKKVEIEDLERKRDYFLKHFTQYFESTETI